MRKIILFLSITLLITGYVSGQWNHNPEENLVICSGKTGSVKSVKTTGNRTFVSWFFAANDSSNSNLYVQLLDKDGNKLWGENGLLVSSHPQSMNIEEQVMLCDDEGNLMIIFSDIRENGNQGLFCYKLSQNGEFLMGNDGLSLIENNDNNWITHISAFYDDQDELIVSAGIFGATNDSFLQRIASDETLPWGIQGLIVPNAEKAKVFSTGEFIVLLFLEKAVGSSNLDFNISYQFFTKNKFAIFPDYRNVSNAGGFPMYSQYDAMMINHQLYVAWHDGRGLDGAKYSYVQKIDSEGNTIWENNGVLLSTEMWGYIRHYYPRIVGLTADSNVMVIWQRTIEPQTRAIFGQKIDESGNITWGEYGKQLVAECDNFNKIEGCVMDSCNFYVAFGLHLKEGSFTDTIHYHLGSYSNTNGDENWTQPVGFATFSSPKSFLNISLFQGIQIVATWMDGGNTDSMDVRGQNIEIDGSLGVGIGTEFNIDENKLVIYPNPSSDYIRVNNHGDNIETISIENMLGSMVYQETVNRPNPEINVSGLKKGIYLLKVQTKNKKIVLSKFVKS